MSEDLPGNFFMVPNALIDRVARDIGPTALVVYVALLRHAGQSGVCVLRQSVLAEETGLARETINRAMRGLSEAKLVSVETTADRSASRFTLLLTARRCDAGSQSTPDVVTQDHNGCDAGSQGLCATITTVVTQDHTQEDSSKKTLLKTQNTESPPTPRTRPDPTQSSVAKKREGDGREDSELRRWFEDCFWPAYPRKDGKATAWSEIEKLRPDEPTRSAMMEGLQRARASPQWRKDSGQFIPHAKTWLHNRRWEDQGVDAPLLSLEIVPARDGIAERAARRAAQYAAERERAASVLPPEERARRNERQEPE